VDLCTDHPLEIGISLFSSLWVPEIDIDATSFESLGTLWGNAEDAITLPISILVLRYEG
jgi:hypothetical protein